MVELGKSKVPLDKNIIPEQPRIFFPTFAEWIADGNAEQIIRTATFTTPGATPIFTVPENFTLFITNLHLSSDITGGGAGNTQASIRLGVNDLIVPIRHTHVIASADHVVSSLSCPMPLKVDSGDSVFLTVGLGTMIASGQICGFLLPKKISIR